MDKIVKWHKEFANKFMKMTGMDSYQLAWFSWIKGFVMGIILMMVLSGCYTRCISRTPNSVQIMDGTTEGELIKVADENGFKTYEWTNGKWVEEKTTHKCKLMEQGKKCLPDHSCCK